MSENHSEPSEIYREKDTDLSRLQDEHVAVIGFGSHGKAHALNLRDSGVEVTIGLRKGSDTREEAAKNGLDVATPIKASEQASIIAIFVPDTIQREVYEEIKDQITAGDTLLFPHGFSIYFNQIEPEKRIDTILVAPKAPGEMVRSKYKNGYGTPGVIAVHQDATGIAKKKALAYSKAIGCTRAGVVETTFKEETVTDLFGEQALLCGGIPFLIMAAYETLVDNGYSREMAYFECLNEVYFVTQLMFEGGFDQLWSEASNTSEYGGLTRGEKIINQNLRKNLNQILDDVEQGTFAREWLNENQVGCPKYNNIKTIKREHDIERVGKSVRNSFDWT